jgi:hypothetical protein
MRKRNQGNFDHTFFDVIDNEAKSYWLGFIMADGCIVTKVDKGSKKLRIHLSLLDQDHLQKFHDAIGSKKELYRWNTTVSSTHSSDRLCEQLIDKGCISNKSLYLEFPEILPNIVHHFVRGYFDGDGSSFVVKNRLFLSFVGTEHFLSNLRSSSPVNQSKKMVKKKNVFELQFGSIPDCTALSNWMYKDATIFLDRKKEVIDNWLLMPRPKNGRPCKTRCF